MLQKLRSEIVRTLQDAGITGMALVGELRGGEVLRLDVCVGPGETRLAQRIVETVMAEHGASVPYEIVEV